MKGKKPFGSRLRKAFLIAAATITGLGGGTGVLLMNKDKTPPAVEITATTPSTNVSDMWSFPRFGDYTAAGYGQQLINAADCGDVFGIHSLLSNPVIYIAQTDKDLALEVGAYRGNQGVVDALMQHGVMLTANDWAAFSAAVEGGHVDLANRIANLSNPSSDVMGEAFITAAEQGNMGMAEMLVNDQGADVSYKNSLSLLVATENSDVEMVKLILAQQEVVIAPAFTRIYDFDKYNGDFFDENVPPNRSTLRLESGMEWENNFNTPQFADVFTWAAANVTANQSEALRAAVSNGNTEIARLLLNAGAEPNAQNGQALLTAVQNNDAIMAQLLLTFNANPDIRGGEIRNIVDKTGDPVMQSVFRGNPPPSVFPVYRL